ncbi:MAG: HAMP domain-containing histidine kinase [Chloroflexi bacterium]|nr:HAMP domain-containing histidine kinase [Chloroflexota bacterium]
MWSADSRAGGRSSLRLRFSAILIVLLAGLLTMHMVGAYMVFTKATMSWADDLLASVAEDAIQTARAQARQHHGLGQGEDQPIELHVPPRFQVQIWYFAPDSRTLIARSANAPTSTLLDPSILAHYSGRPQARLWHRHGRWWRVRTELRPGLIEGRSWVVQVAVDMTKWYDRRPWIVGYLVASWTLVMGFFVLALERLTRWMIWPMEQVSQLAQDIMRTRDLSRRLPTDLPIPELRNWAQAFNAALDRLEHLFWQQRRFLADVSHELRTPLTIIRGQAQLMQRTGQYDAEAVADIEKEAERLARLVEDLLFLARAEAGALPLRQEAVDLDTLLLDVVRQSQMLAERKQQRLELEHLEPLPVVGDPDRLRQAILNLVSNAVQYTPAGGTIWVGARRVGDQAVLWVRDTGPGIPPEDLPHVFERFYRAARSRTRRGGGGFGLGLSIVRWIVEAHGGHIRVASQVGQGTTFTLTLPLDPKRAWGADDDEALWDDEEDENAAATAS